VYFKSNYVGIGTITPLRKLHVVGPDGAVPTGPSVLGAKDIMLFENNNNCHFGFIAGSTDGKTSQLKFYKSGDSYQSGHLQYYHHATTTLNSISMAVGGYTNIVMTILGTGNVKIAGSALRGTTEGTKHLDIFDGTAPVGTLANGISLYSATGVPYFMDAAGLAMGFNQSLLTTDGPTFDHLHISGVAAITTAAESWVGPSSTTGVYFKGGYVGIGTTTPRGKLEVIGKIYGSSGTTGSSIIIDGTAMASNDYSNAYILGTVPTPGAGYLWFKIDNWTGRHIFTKVANGGASDITLAAFDGDGSDVVTGWLPGKVGIGDGVAAPGDQLTVKQASTTGAIAVLQLNQTDVDQPFIRFVGGTIYTTKTGQDEYLMVVTSSGTRYIRMFA
jgi:hypothetical protein